MNQHENQDKVELFRSLEVKEVQERSQHLVLSSSSSSSSYYD